DDRDGLEDRWKPTESHSNGVFVRRCEPSRRGRASDGGIFGARPLCPGARNGARSNGHCERNSCGQLCGASRQRQGTVATNCRRHVPGILCQSAATIRTSNIRVRESSALLNAMWACGRYFAICLLILILEGCSLPDRPPLETPRDWCKDVGK